MLRIDYILPLLKPILVISFIATACAAYAYHVNSRLAEDDPKKKRFHPGAILLIPLLWPFLIVGAVSFLLVKILFYGSFIVLFALSLLLVRTPFLLIWLEKLASSIGRALLAANTLLIEIFSSPDAEKPKTI